MCIDTRNAVKPVMTRITQKKEIPFLAPSRAKHEPLHRVTDGNGRPLICLSYSSGSIILPFVESNEQRANRLTPQWLPPLRLQACICGCCAWPAFIIRGGRGRSGTVSAYLAPSHQKVKRKPLDTPVSRRFGPSSCRRNAPGYSLTVPFRYA